jgi:hypothetical protein
MEMGYTDDSGTWRHPRRKVVFVGDLIDTGPEQLGTLRLARAMMEAGSALAVMGNHEFNAIAWFHGWRPRSPKNQAQHEAFLAEVGDGTDDHERIVRWFEALPAWLDLGGLRVIHACWDEASRMALGADDDGRVPFDAVRAAAITGTPEHDAVEILLKGPEVPLPPGCGYLDRKGHLRERARLRWWSDGPDTYHDRAELPSGAQDADGRPHPGFPRVPLPRPLPVGAYEGPPVIYGHYWRTGALRVTSRATACVDYSAGRGGPLAAYRWSGEEELTDDHLVAVP